MFNQQYKDQIAKLTRSVEKRRAYMDGIAPHIALIEFTPQGEILFCNALFSATMGYSSDELVGKHHRTLCSKEYASSGAYQQFWRELQQAKSQKGVVTRVDKQGKIKH